eukprot:TRINITY_DN13651_c0_g3_i1.p1 TRINITY_DN13651_c0_g3~~TRINITY_DN13651_c0_g3_i1.p1  ORF type:complete len:130 (+),score=21.52 TRINITY_DN13651_c0_g3_i1:97-486(+)
MTTNAYVAKERRTDRVNTSDLPSHSFSEEAMFDVVVPNQVPLCCAHRNGYLDDRSDAWRCRESDIAVATHMDDDDDGACLISVTSADLEAMRKLREQRKESEDDLRMTWKVESFKDLAKLHGHREVEEK